MSWTPNLDSDDLITFDQYGSEDQYGLNLRSIRPGRMPLEVSGVDDEELDDLAPDARAELELEAYRRKLGVPKRAESRWSDDTVEHDSSVDLEISKIIRNTGSDREPVKNPLNSKTTSRTAVRCDKYPVAGMRDVFLTKDHFKFENPYFRSEPKKEKEEPAEEKLNSSPPTKDTSNECTADRKYFKEPTLGMPGENYVSPRQLYLMKGRSNR